MSEPTADEIARWAALAHNATRGPWTVELDQSDARTGFDIYAAGGLIASAVDRGAVDEEADAEFIAAARTAVPRLLALVAAQAEQIAEHKWQLASAANAAFEAEQLPRELAAEPMVIAAVERAERAEAELAALHATDDYQRWARAVVERDAAREQVGRVRALHTPNDPPSSTYAKECMGCDGAWPCETARALDGGAAT